MKLKLKFNNFLKELITNSGQDIITIIEFGSKQVFKYPQISDWDLLVITKTKSQIKPVRKIAKQAESKYLDYPTVQIVNFLEEHFFMKPTFSGIHLVVFSKQDLTTKLEALSWKLKILGFIFGQRFFLHDLKDFGQVRFGQDLIKRITRPRLLRIDLLVVKAKLAVVLLVAPIISLSRLNFKIRCFKVVLYYKRILELYFQLDPTYLREKNPFFEQVSFYRYRPNDYRQGLVKLYFKTWALLYSS